MCSGRRCAQVHAARPPAAHTATLRLAKLRRLGWRAQPFPAPPTCPLHRAKSDTFCRAGPPSLALCCTMKRTMSVCEMMCVMAPLSSVRATRCTTCPWAGAGAGAEGGPGSLLLLPGGQGGSGGDPSNLHDGQVGRQVGGQAGRQAGN